MYCDKDVLLATKHQKERVIAPIFQKCLQANIVVPAYYDTDQFGTFSGEVARSQSAKETCVLKAKKAAEQYGYPYALASEGSFGPHPSIYFIPADIEILSFVDCERNLVVIETIVSEKTNYCQAIFSSSEQVSAFLAKVHFPSHAVMVRAIEKNQVLAKGITDLAQLSNILESGFKQHGKLQIETDMRAMCNPTRMKVIEEVASRLSARLQKNCPGCGAPGFGERALTGQLPCAVCENATSLYQYEKLSCLKCDYSLLQAREDGLQLASPQYCYYCNP